VSGSPSRAAAVTSDDEAARRNAMKGTGKRWASVVAALALGVALGWSPPAGGDKGPDTYAKEGFHTEVDEDGRLWVFRAGSDELKEFKAHGEPAKVVIRPGAGPGGVTIKSVDAEIIDEYLAR
jgi:hypothetical protein